MFFTGLTFTHAHWLFTNKDWKTLAAFVARPFIERFVELMLRKFCDLNDSNVMHCTACKPPSSQASSGPLDFMVCSQVITWGSICVEIEKEIEPSQLTTKWSIVRPRWVDHSIEISLLKVCHLMCGVFCSTTFSSVHDAKFLSIASAFHMQSIKTSPMTVACKTAKLFAFFHRSTQRERTIIFLLKSSCVLVFVGYMYCCQENICQWKL